MLIETTILIARNARLRAVREQLTMRASALFGGCTWLPDATVGAWLDELGNLVEDECSQLVIAVDSLGDLALVYGFARECGHILGEHEVYIRALGVSECVKVGAQ